jgi:uncharacterized membrane protein (DUF485 family)
MKRILNKIFWAFVFILTLPFIPLYILFKILKSFRKEKTEGNNINDILNIARVKSQQDNENHI